MESEGEDVESSIDLVQEEEEEMAHLEGTQPVAETSVTAGSATAGNAQSLGQNSEPMLHL